MTIRTLRTAFLGAACLASAAARAADAPPPLPAAVGALLSCRSITDRDARLTCFDSRASAFDTAIASSEVVVTDRAQIKAARRSLFGLSLPALAIFGNNRSGDSKAEGDSAVRLESKLASASRGIDGRWRFVLEDGARWLQIDTREFPRDPRAGMPIVIRQAAMASYLANVDGQIAVRVRREN